MPIEGLSTKRMIPRIGKIHLGYRDPRRGFPVRTSYFVFPKDHPQYKALVDTFGEQPKELRILIPVEDEEKWSSQYYRAYSQSRGLICKGDGVVATRMVAKGTDELAWKDAIEVEMKDIECKGRECPLYLERKCGEVMNLQFLLPEIPGLGVWQVDTGSVNSIININSGAELIKAIYKKITMIPLLLTLEPKEVNNPETGKKQTVYVLNLRVNVKLADLATLARKQSELYELPVGDGEAPDFANEFEPGPPLSTTVQQDIEQLWPAEPKKAEQVVIVEPPKSPDKWLKAASAAEGQIPFTDDGPEDEAIIEKAKVITMANTEERKMLFAVAEDMGYSHDDVGDILHTRYKHEHTSDLTRAELLEFCDGMRGHKKLDERGEWR